MYFVFGSIIITLFLTYSTKVVHLQAAIRQMSKLQVCATDIQSFTLAYSMGLIGHGCFCGRNYYDTPYIEPVDEMDQCCRIHDRCYAYANLTEICKPMKCLHGLASHLPDSDHEVYCLDYETSCNRDRMIPSCQGSSVCGRFICNCDLAFSLCLRETFYGFYGGRGNWKRKVCPSHLT